MDFKIIKKKSANQKYGDFSNVCDFQKENPYPRDLKIYRKSKD